MRKVDVKDRIWRLQDLEKYIEWCEERLSKALRYGSRYYSGNYDPPEGFERRIDFATEEIRRIKHSMKPPKKRKKK